MTGTSQSSFSGNATDLHSSFAYELDALEFVRTELFGQREGSSGATTVVLGDRTEDGIQRSSVDLSVSIRLSASAVRGSLGRLRPLAFAVAFKLQDMLAEWILRANGVNSWRFQDKLREYRQLISSGSLLQPPLLQQKPNASEAFWALYESFSDYRNAMIHGGGVDPHGGDCLRIRGRNGVLNLSPSEQGYYCRSMCLLARHHAGLSLADFYLSSVIESDLAGLFAHHQVAGLRGGGVRSELLRIVVPPDRLERHSPISIRIDFSELSSLMSRAHPVGPGGLLLFDVVIEVPSETGTSSWSIPADSVPTGTTEIVEGDPSFDRFFSPAEGSQ